MPAVCCPPDGTGTRAGAAQSLNEDPYNLRAEEQALAECTVGQDVRRVWSETEMVRSFGGQMSPGTPDGMFETWDGALTCVQVVRVPLAADSSVADMQEILAQTVLTKVVKSQQWLRMSHSSPEDFVIFCWLPFAIVGEVQAHAQDLMSRIQLVDPRFSLRLRTPTDTSALFPALFAHHRDGYVPKSVTETDVSTFRGSEQDSDDEDEGPYMWDITWGWEQDVTVALEGQQTDQGHVEEELEEDDEPWDWDITWDWEHDWAATPANPGEVGHVEVEDLVGSVGVEGEQSSILDNNGLSASETSALFSLSEAEGCSCERSMYRRASGCG